MEKIFVGTLDGLFKVIRSNGAWKIEGKDLPGAEVNCLGVRPDRREVLYAGVRGGGLFRSDDDGKRWNRVGGGALSDKVRALALDPSNPKVVYVGTEPAALWRSEDEGKSWKEIEGVKKLAGERKWTYPVPFDQIDSFSDLVKLELRLFKDQMARFEDERQASIPIRD